MFMDALRKGLKKTRDILFSDVKDLIRGRITERLELPADFWQQLEERLIVADVGVSKTAELVDILKRELKGKKLRSEKELWEVIRKQLRTLIDIPTIESDSPYWPLRAPASGLPLVVLVLGVNGTGKTSFIAKLARYYQQRGLSVLLGAGDTYRAAAIEQLVALAQKLGVPVIKQQRGADSAAVAFDTANAARARGINVAIIDTSGRMHTKHNLMQELQKIERVLAKVHPDFPQESLLVLDGTFGQNAIYQARAFTSAVKVTGIVVTKLDSSSKAGFVFNITSSLGIPIKFLTVGEKLEDLVVFNPDEFVAALVG